MARQICIFILRRLKRRNNDKSVTNSVSLIFSSAERICKRAKVDFLRRRVSILVTFSSLYPILRLLTAHCSWQHRDRKIICQGKKCVIPGKKMLCRGGRYVSSGRKIICQENNLPRTPKQIIFQKIIISSLFIVDSIFS